MATKEELSRLFQQAGLGHFDIAPVEGTKPQDLNKQKLHDYWQTFYSINYRDMATGEQNRLLLNADILVERLKGMLINKELLISTDEIFFAVILRVESSEK